jgi:hypothetical protein
VVAGLRKPSLAAWVVNQLVRSEDRAVGELFEAGDALRAAQSGVLAGRAEAGALRGASGRERAAVDVLLEKARGLLGADGQQLSAVILDRVAETLHAAALEDDARRLISAGCLERELRHVGLGAGIDAESLSSGPESPAATAREPGLAKPGGEPTGEHRAGSPGRHADRTGAKQRADAVRLAARERMKARRLARATVSEARRDDDRAARVLRSAEQRREQAAEALRRAEEDLARAHADAQATAEAHRQAKQRLETL